MKLSIETVQQRIGGQREGRCLNSTTFLVDMRCLTIITMFNLYPIKKFPTINNARAIFLMELKEKTFIDISSHIFVRISALKSYCMMLCMLLCMTLCTT